VVSDVQERVRDLGSPLRFMLRRSSLVECVSVLHGTCLQKYTYRPPSDELDKNKQRTWLGENFSH
jgi:hypothetical protein